MHDSQLPTLGTESKSAKIPKSLYGGGWVGVGGREVCDGQLPTFDAESKSAKIPKSLYGGGGGGGGREGGCVMANFQLLMLSPNLLKSQSPFMVGAGVHDDQLPTVDAESKSAKIPKFLYSGGGGGGGA